MSTTGKPLTVRQLIGQLMYQDPDAGVIAFASGEDYPVILVEQVNISGEQYTELACGWQAYDEHGRLEGADV